MSGWKRGGVGRKEGRKGLITRHVAFSCGHSLANPCLAVTRISQKKREHVIQRRPSPSFLPSLQPTHPQDHFEIGAIIRSHSKDIILYHFIHADPMPPTPTHLLCEKVKDVSSPPPTHPPTLSFFTLESREDLSPKERRNSGQRSVRPKLFSQKGSPSSSHLFPSFTSPFSLSSLPPTAHLLFPPTPSFFFSFSSLLFFFPQDVSFLALSCSRPGPCSRRPDPCDCHLHRRPVCQHHKPPHFFSARLFRVCCHGRRPCRGGQRSWHEHTSFHLQLHCRHLPLHLVRYHSVSKRRSYCGYIRFFSGSVEGMD